MDINGKFIFDKITKQASEGMCVAKTVVGKTICDIIENLGSQNREYSYIYI